MEVFALQPDGTLDSGQNPGVDLGEVARAWPRTPSPGAFEAEGGCPLPQGHRCHQGLLLPHILNAPQRCAG